MPLLQYIRLIDIMARMGLRADASRFFLGYVWWILEPLLWVGVFYVVFVTIMGTREPDFLMFLATGKLVFVWFSKSVYAGFKQYRRRQGFGWQNQCPQDAISDGCCAGGRLQAGSSVRHAGHYFAQ